MALPMTPIFTQTVGAGGAGSVTFNNIPQFYTDIKIVISSRASGAGIGSDMIMSFNSGANIYSSTYLASNYIQRQSNTGYILLVNEPGASAVSNIFSNTEVYIPNYSGSNSKSVSVDATAEDNSSSGTVGFVAGLYQTSSAISQVNFSTAGNGGFTQHSTFSLYGIIRPGA